MRALAIVSLVLAVLLVGSSASAAALEQNWQNLNGSFDLPGIWANWNGSGQDSRARTDVSAKLEDAFFTSGRFSLNSLQETPSKFYGTFHWEGLFKGRPDNGRHSYMDIDRRGVSLSMGSSVSYDENQLFLSGWASLFPADITSNAFRYSERDLYVGWSEELQEPIYEPGWCVDYGFGGNWLSTNAMTAKEVGAMFPSVPEPATLGLFVIGSVLAFRKRR